MKIKPSILIADDFEPNLEVLSTILSASGYEVSVARNVAKLMSLLRQQNFNLIMLDISMPEMSGFEAVEYIRNNYQPYRKNLRIIAMSGSDSDLYGDREFISAGFDYFLSKPFSVEKLLSVVSELCSIEG